MKKRRTQGHREFHWLPAGPRGLVNIALLLISCASGFAASERPSEYDVKAAYLFNFGKFLRRPAQNTSVPATFDICVLGHDPFGHMLDGITRDERLDNLPVRTLRPIIPEEARTCAILFISNSEADQLDKVLNLLDGSSTLTVSEIPDFLQRGGMIQFLLDEERVRFSVNLDAVAHSHLALGSELLRVAKSISGKAVPREQP